MLISKSPGADREIYLKSAERSGLAMDEMFQNDGTIQPHWAEVARRFESASPADMRRLLRSTRRQIHENGITFSVEGTSGGTMRPWEIDPVPFVISPADWSAIESGLQQRAELLNLILKDLYGPRKLIRDRLLPPELVYSHAGFLRPCDKVLMRGEHELLLYHADLARGPDGRMWVVNDRTQAPSGSGYALENRVVSSRVLPELFRDCQVRRLASFFRELKSTLQSLAPNEKDDPRIVVLTPGPFNETYFEHAYLAAYLGFTLVQGDDLTVRDGKVWLRSLAGLEPVDIILRRCDAAYCDPLELRPESRLGVPGLLQAIRLGNVVIANPLGSGALENPALMAFLPAIARYFLDQELALPSAATWWCGHESERNHVLQNLEKMVVKSINRAPSFGTVFCESLSDRKLAKVRAGIVAHPELYVGQERVSFSTAPCLVDGKLQPRHSVLRGILAASTSGNGSGYVVMPGGLTRSAGRADTMVVTSTSGGIAKDTWVLSEKPEQFVSLWSTSPHRLAHALASDERNLPSRSGENLFWVGRYAERTEGTARILRRILERFIDTYSKQDPLEIAELRDLVAALHGVTDTEPLSAARPSDENRELSFPEDELISMLTDTARIGSLSSTLSGFMNSCYAVRDLWSPDSWRVIDRIESKWKKVIKRTGYADLFNFPDELNSLITRLMALTGLNLESMTRQAGWVLLDSGRRVERSLVIIGLLRSMLVEQKGEALDDLNLESLLSASDSLVTHQRRFRSQPRPETILKLLLKEENYPRSVFYQVNRMRNHFPGLPGHGGEFGIHPADIILMKAHDALENCDERILARPDAISGARGALAEVLDCVSGVLLELSDCLTRSYFDHAGISTSLRG